MLMRIELSGFNIMWSFMVNLVHSVFALMSDITIGGISLLVLMLSLVALGILFVVVLPLIKNDSPAGIGRRIGKGD